MQDKTIKWAIKTPNGEYMFVKDTRREAIRRSIPWTWCLMRTAKAHVRGNIPIGATAMPSGRWRKGNEPHRLV